MTRTERMDAFELTSRKLNDITAQIDTAGARRDAHARNCVSFLLADLPNDALTAARHSKDAAEHIEDLWEQMRQTSSEVVS